MLRKWQGRHEKKARMLRWGHPRSGMIFQKISATAIVACLKMHAKGSTMTYKLNPQLRLIKAPVILLIDRQEQSFGSGQELTNLAFEKNDVIESISARDDKVVVTLKENDRQFMINWIGEEEVSFM